MSSGDELRAEHHVKRYVIDLRKFVSLSVLHGADVNNVFQGLMKRGRIQAFPYKNVSYYMLTAEAARDHHLPDTYCTPPNTEAFHRHMSLLFFCHAPGTKRLRIEFSEMKSLFPANEIERASGRPHVLELGDGMNRVYQVFPTTRPNITRELEAEFHKLSKCDTVAKWIAGGFYAFAVLTESEALQEKLLSHVIEHELNTRIHVTVEVTPGARTFLDALKTRSDGGSDAAERPGKTASR